MKARASAMCRRRLGLAVAGGLAAAATAAAAQGEADGLRFPTTQFAAGADSASVTVGDLTATITMARRPEIDPDSDVPVLTVAVGGVAVIETPGVASGLDFPATEASITEIDPDNAHPEVFFTSYSGGAHCCATVVVAEELAGTWAAVPVGDFDGDGDYLNDLDNDGIAEIATVDNRFLYQFDCYACSAAPLIVLTVRGGEVRDVSGEGRYLTAHREWLTQVEAAVDPAERWTSPGFLAGWLAQKARVGEGATAWNEINARWDFASDRGEPTCLTGGDPENCPKRELKVLSFPKRLKLFLDQTGYSF